MGEIYYYCNFESWLACEYCEDYFVNKKLFPNGKKFPSVNPYYDSRARQPIYGGCETCRRAWEEGKDRIIKGLHGGKARSMRDYCWLYTIEQMIRNGDYPKDWALQILEERLNCLNERYIGEDAIRRVREKTQHQMVLDSNFSLS